MKRLALILFGLLIVSCSDNQVEKLRQLKEDPESTGKQIELVGNIEMDVISWNLKEGEETSAKFKVSNALNDREFETIPIKITYGKTKNSFFINIPDGQKEYTAADVVVYDKDGNQFKIGQEVKVTATMQLESEKEKTSNSLIKMDKFKPKKEESPEEKEAKRKYLNNITITLE